MTSEPRTDSSGRSATTSFWQRGAAISRSIKASPAWVLRKDYVLTAFFTLQICSLVFLQKFAIDVDFSKIGLPFNGGIVEAVVPVMYLGLAVLILASRPKVDLVRLILFVAVLLSATLSILLQQNLFSANSVMLMVVIYAPFVFVFEVEEARYRSFLRIFQNVMLFIGLVVIAQHVVQIIWSWRLWPNLNQLIPDQFQFPDFNYNQPIKFGSRLMKPQGIFFLEVSTMSQWMALAFAIELVYFRKPARLLFYAVVTLISFAGTGLFLLLICAPVLLTRLSPRSVLMVFLILGACYLLADRIHWYQQVNGRLNEYQHEGTSGYARFVQPFQELIDFTKQSNAMFVGVGPGNTGRAAGEVTWATTKVITEYGFLTAIAFFSFFTYSLFAGSPSKRFAFVLFVLFNIMGGGIIIPIYPGIVYMLGVLFRPKRKSRRKTSRSRSRPQLEPRAAAVGHAGA